jgi:pre-mRNA-splicing factor SYF1
MSQGQSQRAWWNTILNTESFTQRCQVYEEALEVLPGSYKLWFNYLHEVRTYVQNNESLDHYELANTLHERSLTFMHQMPQIWLDYAEFLAGQGHITRTRKVFDLSLNRLPLTQHDLIWEAYLPWSLSMRSTESTCRILRRYLIFNPGYLADFVDFLINNQFYSEAVVRIQELLNVEDSPELWRKLAEVVSKHPESCRYSDELLKTCESRMDDKAEAWGLLAEFYIRSGDLDNARATYEKALNELDSVKHFTVIFAAYAELEEQVLQSVLTNPDAAESAISRLETLLTRREELLSDVKLRENPNDVEEWLKRVSLYPESIEKQLRTYAKAVTLVDPFKARGSPQHLWINFAKLYENHGQMSSARLVFHKGTLSTMKKSDQLADIWEEWIEMELRHRHYSDALHLSKTVCLKQQKSYKAKTAQAEVSTSIRLWSLYLDLEESLGSLESTREAYEKMITNKFATVQTVLNYVKYLEGHELWEESFRAYEKGLNKFSWPHVYDVWVSYLTSFVSRFGKTKLERARDLFEQVLSTCPKDKIKVFYMMYAQLEEKFGLGNHVIEIFEKAIRDVPTSNVPEVFLTYMQKVNEFYGIIKMRNLFELGFEVIQETSHVIDLGLQFVEIEKKLGEVERARNIFIYISQFCDARKTEHLKFWNKWNEFEVYHGSQDTFREMMRIKRTSMFNAAGVNLADLDEPDEGFEEDA